MLRKIHIRILTIAFGIGFFTSAALFGAQEVPIAPETSEMHIKPTAPLPSGIQPDLPKLPEAPKEIKAPKEEMISIPTPKIPEPSLGESKATPAEKMSPTPSMMDTHAMEKKPITEARPAQEPQTNIIDRLSPFEQPIEGQKSTSASAVSPSEHPLSQEPAKITLPEIRPSTTQTSMASTSTEEKRTTCDVHMEHMSQRLATVEQLLANVMNQLNTINQTLQKQASIPAPSTPIIITTGPVNAAQPCVALTTTTTTQPQQIVTPVVTVPQQTKEMKVDTQPVKPIMHHKKPMRRRMMMTKKSAPYEHHEAMSSHDKSSVEKRDSSSTPHEMKSGEQKVEQTKETTVAPKQETPEEVRPKKEEQSTIQNQKSEAAKKVDELDLSDLDFNEELPLAESL